MSDHGHVKHVTDSASHCHVPDRPSLLAVVASSLAAADPPESWDLQYLCKQFTGLACPFFAL